MARSIKLKNNDFIDSTGITHEKKLLSTILNEINTNKQDKLTVERVNITSNYSCIKVYRYGNLVSIDIDGYIQEVSGIIATNIPKSVYLAYINVLGSTTEWLCAKPSGELQIQSHKAGNWVNAHLVYITNE